jgi:hypothetical protein
MSDTFGALYINGIQQGLPGGGIQGIGPFAIPCSGNQDTNIYGVNTSITITVPSVYVPQGVLIIPPTGGTVAFRFKTVSADSGVYLNPSLPSFINFDPSNLPVDVYLVSASSVDIGVQFI